MSTTSMGYALRAGAAAAAAAVAVGFAVPAGASTTAGSADRQWGANQERPVGPPGQDSAVTGTDSSAGRQATTASPQMAAPLATTAAATPGRVLHGSGWGHGIGMSQYGAMEMARDGYKAPAILAHYYTGTTYDARSDAGSVRVNIRLHSTSTTLTTVAKSPSDAAGVLSLQAKGSSTITRVPAGRSTVVSRSGDSVVVSCSTCSPTVRIVASEVYATWNDGHTLVRVTPRQLSTDSGLYESGRLTIAPTPKAAPADPSTATWEVVNQVRVADEYLNFLREMPWGWPSEALKVQAVAARGYALSHTSFIGSCQCNLYNSTRSQVYGGYPVDANGSPLPLSNTDFVRWRVAVNETATDVLTYHGSIIQALYSSSSGGRTENNEDVWGGTPLPYLRGVADPWSLRPSNPNAHWTQTTSGPSMASVFGLSDVVRLDLRNRTVNGGVKYATATSSSGATRTIRGDSLRAIAASPGGAVKSTMIRHLTGRLAGSDRYASATAVARRINVSASSIVIAGGDTTLSDASVAGPLAATLGSPLLLTQQAKLPSATVTELNRRGSAVKTAYVVGGTGVVSDAVAQQLRNRGIAVTRLGGRDRYETSALVAKAIRARRSTPTVVVAGGNGLPDALGASGPASALREPILLTQVDRLTPTTRDAIKTIGATQSRIVGGTAVVSAAVQSELSAMGVRPIRLAGANRYESSGAVAAFYRRYLPVTSEVVLTSGADSALVDSLVAGTLQRLMVLTSKYSLVEPAARTLQSTPLLETITAVGGTGALANSALTAAANS